MTTTAVPPSSPFPASSPSAVESEDEVVNRLDSINERLPTCSNAEEREKLAHEAKRLTALLRRFKTSSAEESLPSSPKGETKEEDKRSSGSRRSSSNSNTSSNSSNSSNSSKLAGIPKVKIADGTFKYVLIRVKGKDVGLPDEKDVYLVRGRADARYHYQCAAKVSQKLENRGIPHVVTGGGRIRHDPDEKTVTVYGFSYQYGQADHSITCRAIQEHYGKDYKVDWNNEGY